MRLRFTKPRSEDVVEFFTYFAGMGIFSVAMYLLFIFPVLGVVFLPYTVMFLSFVFFDRLIKPAFENSFEVYQPKRNFSAFDQSLPEFIEEQQIPSSNFGLTGSNPHNINEKENQDAAKIEQKVA